MAYYSIQDILCEELQVTVCMSTQVLRMGHLEPGNPREDLAKDTKLRLPLWMAQKLEGEDYCTMELPQQYGRKFASAVNAGAKCTKKTTHLGMYPYWYELGIKLAFAMPKDCDRITKMLNDAFQERYIEIFNYAQNWRNEDIGDVKKRWCIFEQQLYAAESRASIQFEQWKDRPITKIVASELAHLDEEPIAQSGMERTTKRQKGD